MSDVLQAMQVSLILRLLFRFFLLAHFLFASFIFQTLGIVEKTMRYFGNVNVVTN